MNHQQNPEPPKDVKNYPYDKSPGLAMKDNKAGSSSEKSAHTNGVNVKASSNPSNVAQRDESGASGVVAAPTSKAGLNSSEGSQEGQRVKSSNDENNKKSFEKGVNNSSKKIQ